MKRLNVKVERAKFLQWCIYFYAALCFVVLKAVPYVNDDVFICISIIVLTYFIGKDCYEALKTFVEISREHKARNYCLLLICSLILSFSVGANDWFYHEFYGCWAPSLWGGTCYFTMVIYNGLLCMVVNYWVVHRPFGIGNYVKERRKFEYLIFGVFLSSGILYLIAYNPAHMHADTYAQLKQAFGMEPLHDWHPVFHTLLLKLFLSICDSPAFFAVFHIALFSYVMTLWITKLHEKGISATILLCFSLSFYLNIAYGFLITDIWKDNIYNTLIIWITYLLYCMEDDFSQFDCRKSNYVLLVVCTVGICLSRHNGVVPAIFILIMFLSVGLWLKKKRLIVAGLIIGLICFVCKPLSYQAMQVVPNENGIKYIPIVHDIASILVYNQGETLPNEVVWEMESIIPLELWCSHYVSTDSDTYTFQINEFLPNLGTKSTGEMISLYIKAGMSEPVRLVAARAMSAQQLWSLFKRNGQGDYLGEKANDPQIEQDFGYIRSENILTPIADHMYDVFESSKILNTIFFRTGIWMDIMVLAVFAMVVNGKLKRLCVLVPIVGYMVSLLIAMTCQNLRYVWAVFLMGVLFFLLVKAECYKKT